MKRWTTLLVALAVAGCGGDDEQAAEGGGERAAAPPPGTIVIEGFAYEPADFEAKVGDTITLINQDSAPHDIESKEGPQVKTAILQQGEKATFTVEEAGTVEYICSIHPQMNGKLTISE